MFIGDSAAANAMSAMRGRTGVVRGAQVCLYTGEGQQIGLFPPHEVMYTVQLAGPLI